MYKKLLTALIAFAFLTINATAGDIQITDDIKAGDKVTWTKDNVYHLNGFVFVEDGAELHIEAGTVIKGMPGQAENASALIIAQGGKIFAEGTADEPIIFTAEADDPSITTDLPIDATGLWGGLIILGKAQINTATGIGQIEGIPSEEPRGAYGGDDDADNSGVVRYVSIRHGGTNIGANNEINGLTMGGVGNGTTIEYVEVFCNADDGFEWFGGTVNTKYLVSAFNEDDSFDYDEGFRGKGQYWFSIQGTDRGNMGGEHDGGTTPEDGTPYAIPEIRNVTYIGSGATGTGLNSKSKGLHFRDNAGGKYYNSIFTDMGGKGIEIEDLAEGEDSRTRLEEGDLALQNNLWFGFGAGSTFDAIAPDVMKDGQVEIDESFVRNYLNDAANNNWMESPMLKSISRTQDKGLDPRPEAGSPALSKAVKPATDNFFDDVNYIGAFDGTNLWLKNWTTLDDAGFLTDAVSVEERFTGYGSRTYLRCYPNPIQDFAELSFEMSETGNVRISVVDALGREVDVLVNKQLTKGAYTASWNAQNLNSGIYMIRYQMNNTVTIEKVIISR